MSVEREPGRRRPSRIGPWRLLDIALATLPWRTAMLSSVAMLPEYGTPDAPSGAGDVAELPDSNLNDDEQRQAVRRESARRFVRTRREQRG